MTRKLKHLRKTGFATCTPRAFHRLDTLPKHELTGQSFVSCLRTEKFGLESETKRCVVLCFLCNILCN